jgi:hypothetical protein
MKKNKKEFLYYLFTLVITLAVLFILYLLKPSYLKSITLSCEAEIIPIVTNTYSKKNLLNFKCEKNLKYGDVITKNTLFATFIKDGKTEYITLKNNLFFLSKDCKQDLIKLGKKNILIKPIFKENKKYIGYLKDTVNIEAYLQNQLLYRFTNKIKSSNRNLINIKNTPDLILKDKETENILQLGIPIDKVQFKSTYCCVYDN